jgi:hypothetical protein
MTILSVCLPIYLPRIIIHSPSFPLSTYRLGARDRTTRHADLSVSDTNLCHKTNLDSGAKKEG